MIELLLYTGLGFASISVTGLTYGLTQAFLNNKTGDSK